MATLLMTTNPGLEDLTGAEFQAIAGSAGIDDVSWERSADGLGGRVLVHSAADWQAMVQVALQLRSIHHVHRRVGAFTLPETGALAYARERIAAMHIPELVGAESFRASCERRGAHDFTSDAMAAAAGAGVIDRTPVRVDLKGFAVHLRCDVHDQNAQVTIQHTRAPLTRRHIRPWIPRVALRPNVAWALLELGSVDRTPTSILDPFCGSGTVLLEAASMFPDIPLWGVDVSERAVESAGQAMTLAHLGDRANVMLGDATRLSETLPAGRYDTIVTDPPFGLRLGRRLDFRQLYRRTMASCGELQRPGDRLVVLVLKRASMNHALSFADCPYRTAHVRVIGVGQVHPAVFVLERRDVAVNVGPQSV